MPAPGLGTYVNTITRAGKAIRYVRISSGPQRDKYVHQLVAEAMLGRSLQEGEEVDHLDQNTLNNDWRNLEVVSCEEHGRRTRAREKPWEPPSMKPLRSYVNGKKPATQHTQGA